jgi:hypothetical protein
MDVEQITQDGLAALRRNLDIYPAFDPTKPYQEKNAYFEEVVRIGASLISDEGFVAPAEHYYRSMVDTIRDYERQNSKPFNKGMVYANLGVILTAHANLDEGIHYLLLADKEDAPFMNIPHGVLTGGLWRQFEDRHVIRHLLQLDANAQAGLHFQVTEPFIMAFLERIALADRLLLETTIWTIFRNLEFNSVHSNEYTRGRLYSGTRDICLLTETLLRKKQISDGTIAANTQVTLGTLLGNALRGHGIGYPHPALSTGADSLLDFRFSRTCRRCP